MTAPWADQPKGARLEYRASADLERPAEIARHVVAMLNASGGHVVIGLSDDGAVHGVDDAARRSAELLRELQDRIRPTPGPAVRARPVRMRGLDVVEIAADAPRPGSQLHAERTDGRWGYWVRTGCGIRALDWDEIQSSSPRSRWTRLMDAAPPGPTLLVECLQDAPGDEVELDDLLLAVSDGASRVVGKRIGWTVFRDPGTLSNVGGAIGVEMPGAGRQLRIERNLDARFLGSTRFLSHLQPDGAPGPVLYPYALTEGPASFARLLAILGDAFGRTGSLRLALGLWRVGDWGIRQGAPGSYAWQYGDPGREWLPSPADSLAEVRDSTWEAVRSRPDREVFPLVARLYEDFGGDRAGVPFWDPRSEQFRF